MHISSEEFEMTYEMISEVSRLVTGFIKYLQDIGVIPSKYSHKCWNIETLDFMKETGVNY